MNDTPTVTARHVKRNVFAAAADALEAFRHDPTRTARGSRSNAADRAFSAAMDELRGAPLDDRPDAVVSEVDAVTLQCHHDSRAETARRLSVVAAYYGGEL